MDSHSLVHYTSAHFLDDTLCGIEVILEKLNSIAYLPVQDDDDMLPCGYLPHIRHQEVVSCILHSSQITNASVSIKASFIKHSSDY